MPTPIELNFIDDFEPFKRATTANKSQFGHIGILGGDEGMSGAVILAGQAALRSGAGRVTLLSRKKHVGFLNLLQPELMVKAVETLADLKTILAVIDVLALGPGFGKSEWAENLFLECIRHPLPIIMDADALNFLAIHRHKRQNWILTPHPGEAARMLGTTPTEIQSDRTAAVIALQKTYGGIVVLKGSETLICDPTQQVWVCQDGTPWMATPGMGDTLTGMIAAFVGQKLSHLKAAQMAVMLHAHTADLLHAKNNSVVLASDVIANLKLT